MQAARELVYYAGWKPTKEQQEAANHIMSIAWRQPPSYTGQDNRYAAAFLAARDARIRAEAKAEALEFAANNCETRAKDAKISDLRFVISGELRLRRDFFNAAAAKLRQEAGL